MSKYVQGFEEARGPAVLEQICTEHELIHSFHSRNLKSIIVVAEAYMCLALRVVWAVIKNGCKLNLGKTYHVPTVVCRHDSCSSSWIKGNIWLHDASVGIWVISSRVWIFLHELSCSSPLTFLQSTGGCVRKIHYRKGRPVGISIHIVLVG